MLKLVAGFLGFPLLPIAAFFHGVVWILCNLIKNSSSVFGALLFAPSTLRRTPVDFIKVLSGLLIMGTAFSSEFFLFKRFASYYPLEMNLSLWIILALTGTNILSALYEAGRWYWKSVLKKGTSEAVVAKPESAEAPKADDPNDIFEELYNELQALVQSGFTAEAIAQFVQKLTEIFKKDKLTPDQYLHLMQLVKNAKRNRVTKPASA